ncbi:hypothetical protein LguiA_030490 [Lonicera macranthoides]
MNNDGRIPLILGNSTVASASTNVGAQYEVFLSFCGEDTRKGFTDFLYTYLKCASIRTFKDNEGLHVGEEIGPVLLKALKESKISILIFSKNYASSKWCLNELVQMVQCHENKGQVIYPIFYDVDPYNVRHQSGIYEEAFRQHREKRFKEKTIQGWKQALKKIGQIKGLELKKETNGHEGELVKKVTKMGLLKLKRNYTHVSDNLVRMDEHIKEMEGLLNVGSDGHAFMRDSPNEEYYSLAKDFVSITVALPWVLVTIGSLFFGKKDKALWEEK